MEDLDALKGSIDALSVAIAKLTTSVDLLISKDEGKLNPETVATKQELCPTALTAVRLSKTVVPYGYHVEIKALSTNVGLIYVANSKPMAEDTTMSFELDTSENVKLDVANVDELWIMATNAGEGVSWIVEQEGPKR